MRKLWQIREVDESMQKELAENLSISPIIAQLLINRNIKTPKEADEFLNPSLVNLHDPFLMKGNKVGLHEYGTSFGEFNRLFRG